MLKNITLKQKLTVVFLLLFAITTVVFIFFREGIAKTGVYSAGAWVKSFFTIADQKYFNLLEDYGNYDELAAVVDNENSDSLWAELQMADVVTDNQVYAIVLLNAKESIVSSAGNFSPEMISNDVGKIDNMVKYYTHYKYFSYINDSLFSIYAVGVKHTDKTPNEKGGILMAIGYIPNMVKQILPSELWHVEYVNNQKDLKQSLNPIIINQVVSNINDESIGVLQFQFSGNESAIGTNFWLWYLVISGILLLGYFFITNTKLGSDEQRIKESYKNLKVIVESMPAMMYAKNKRGIFEMVNKRFATTFGLTPDDFLNKHVRRFKMPPEIMHLFDEDESLMKSGQENLGRIRYMSCFENREKCYSISKVPYSHDGQNIDGIYCSIMDITQGRERENNLIEKNRLFQNTIDNLTDLYLRIGLSGEILQASKSCCEAFGYNNVNEIIGMMITTVVENSLNWKELERAGVVKGLSFKIKNRLGKVLYCEANINPFEDSEGHIAGWEGIIHNVTERKQYEQQLKSLTENLMNSLEQTEEKKNQLENVHRRMEESLTYAKRIQDAIFFPSSEKTSKVFPDSFVLYKPCDIVGGDFYYITEIDNKKVCIVADCTGHGVPGALMSVLSASLLSDIINTHSCGKEFTPACMLENIRTKIIATLQNSVILRDGLDIAVIFMQGSRLEYAGANIPLLIVHNGMGQVYEPTKCPIGIYPMQLDFKNDIIETTPGDMVYIATDGFADQFGISENRKYSRRDFNALLSSIAHEPCDTQKNRLEEELLK